MPVTIQSAEAGSLRQMVTANGHQFYVDVSEEKGGQNTAADPHQLLFAAWGACTSMTIQMYANRKGWPLEGVTVTVDEEKKNGKPLIRKTIKLTGNLTPEQNQMLERIAEKCPVNQLIVGDKAVQKEFIPTTAQS